MSKRSKPRGYTIVELMVTLAVAAILMGFAIPAFNDFLRQRTMTSAVNDFVLAMTFARSEAVRRGERVSVQAYDDDNDNEWGPGYCVMIGNAGDCNDDDDVLRHFSPLEDAEYRFNAVQGVAQTGTLTFNARGMLAPLPGQVSVVELCSTDEEVTRGRRVLVGLTGQPDSQDHEDCHD